MPRRTASIALVAASALLAASCGNSGPTPGGQLTADQRAAREQLIQQNKSLNDVQLAHLCPALYPKNALSNLKKYGFEGQKAAPVTFTSAQLAQAKAARCGSPVAFAAQKKQSAPAKK